MPYQRKLGNPERVRDSAQFYERRKLVPLLAVPLDPWLGARGLRAVSLAGYVLLGVALYALLRVWFPLRLALPVAALVLLLGPVREWSSSPLTDSWGLALATAALVAGGRVLSGHGRWLVAWAALVLALGFTRDLDAHGRGRGCPRGRGTAHARGDRSRRDRSRGCAACAHALRRAAQGGDRLPAGRLTTRSPIPAGRSSATATSTASRRS